MSLQIPAWLNEEFLQKVLKKSDNDESVQVKNIVTACATTTGDNYLSVILRVTVDYTSEKLGHRVTKKRSLIVKLIPPPEAGPKDMVLKCGVFDTEIEMMETTLEKMNDTWDEKGCRLNARLLYNEKGNSPFLVLEDLTPLGYSMPYRQTGLDFEHCTLVIRKLAIFHATSVALWEKDPMSVTKYKKGIYHDSTANEMKQLFVDGMKVLSNEVLKWEELGSRRSSYAKKFLKLSKVCFDRGVQLCKPKDGSFNVLIHGDTWANNQLFRYNDDGSADDVIFVDFQMSMWSSPAVDVLHFINTSTSEDVELHHFDDLIEEYLNVLTKAMLKVGCCTKSPSMSEFRKSLEEHEFVEVLASVVAFAWILMDKSDAKTFVEISEQGDDFVSPVYKKPMFRRRMIRRLIKWNNSGIIDV